MAKMTKDEFLDALKKAREHKEQIRKKTEQEWEREGIKGKVVLL